MQLSERALRLFGLQLRPTVGLQNRITNRMAPWVSRSLRVKAPAKNDEEMGRRRNATDQYRNRFDGGTRRRREGGGTPDRLFYPAVIVTSRAGNWPLMKLARARRDPSMPEAVAASGFPQNALDLADGNPIDLGNLRNGHAVFQPSSNSSEMGRRDLGRHRRLGVAGSFGLGMPDRRRRRSGQDPRFPLRRLGRGAGVRNRKLGVLPFWPEQRLRGCNGTTEKRDTVSKQSGAGGGKSHPIALRPKRRLSASTARIRACEAAVSGASKSPPNTFAARIRSRNITPALSGTSGGRGPQGSIDHRVRAERSMHNTC